MVDLIPHGVCLASEPWLVATLVFANIAIFVAYVGIALAIPMVYRVAHEAPIFTRLALWFSAFILLCGFTHLAAVITIYFGGYAYALEAATCISTALVSLITLVLMWKAMPAILRVLNGAEQGRV